MAIGTFRESKPMRPSERRRSPRGAGSIRGTSDAFIHEGERVASSHVSDIEPLDVKSSRRDEVIDLAVEMTTAAEAFPARRETALPARDGAVGRQTVLDE